MSLPNALSDSDAPGTNLSTHWIGHLLIAISLAIVAGKIAVVTSREGDTAFLSANDRSRWCTVASLVEDNTFAIDRQMAIKDKTGKRRPWASIDRVQHLGTDGKIHDYSSKPPLFSILVAGVYWPIAHVLGLTLTAQPIYTARIVLALVNLPLLWIMLLAVWRSLRLMQLPLNTQLYGLAAAGLGTCLTSMAVSLNNHLPAATTTAVTLAIYLLCSIKKDNGRSDWYFGLAGLMAAATVANELPALAMLAVWTLLFVRLNLRFTLMRFAPGVIVVFAAIVLTNYVAHQSWRPPYSHRADGPALGMIESTQSNQPPQLAELQSWLTKNLTVDTTGLRLVQTSEPARWIVQNTDRSLQYALVRQSEDASRWTLHQWDHWYDYPGSYWTKPRPGVDAGEPSRLKYAFQLTLGHHGIFSLTPIWCLIPFGLICWLNREQSSAIRLLAASISMVTLVCFAFYLSRPLIDRNYGGVSCCFRWMLWFAPLWLWSAAPAITRLDCCRMGRVVLGTLLAVSIFSVATSLQNPWQHPWIYRYFSFLGWIVG